MLNGGITEARAKNSYLSVYETETDQVMSSRC
jgi:hypothetical protein